MELGTCQTPGFTPQALGQVSRAWLVLLTFPYRLVCADQGSGYQGPTSRSETASWVPSDGSMLVQRSGTLHGGRYLLRQWVGGSGP